MKIAIVTCDLEGLAAHHLPKIIQHTAVEIGAVIYTQGQVVNKKKFYWKKLQKVWKIGLGGTLNGFRMRSWYREGLKNYLEIPHLKDFCQQKGLPFIEVSSLNSPEAINVLKNAEVDLGISLGNGYISSRFFSIPRYGMINIHHEQLPDYQNAQSVIWQIYNDSQHTGFTIHKISSKIDAGDILLQRMVPIDFKNTLKETVSATYAKLYEASATGLIDVLNEPQKFLENALTQSKGKSYTTPSLVQFYKIYRNFNRMKKAGLASINHQ